MEQIGFIKGAITVLLLALFWCWETWRPFFGKQEHRYRRESVASTSVSSVTRYRHAGRNLALAIFNTLVLGITFGTLTALVTHWTQEKRFGLLNLWGFPQSLQFALALVLLDAWTYCWHRANHAIPLLWRFHRMHHSDPQMDVTTATRFHLGEHVGGAVLRLGLIPLIGLTLWQILVYETVVVAITQLHHADVSLGKWDRWLRWVIVTPDVHKVHHSRCREETDSNYATVLSVWDRIARTFRMRADTKTIQFGLENVDDGRWQTLWGMLKTPFVRDFSDVSSPAHSTPSAQPGSQEQSASEPDLRQASHPLV